MSLIYQTASGPERSDYPEDYEFHDDTHDDAIEQFKAHREMEYHNAMLDNLFGKEV